MIEQNCNSGDFNETANGSKKKYVLLRKYLFCLIKYYRYMFSFKEGLQNKMFFFKKINEIMPKIVSKTLFSCIATVLAFLGRDDDATRDH